MHAKITIFELTMTLYPLLRHRRREIDHESWYTAPCHGMFRSVAHLEWWKSAIYIVLYAVRRLKKVGPK